MTKKEFQEKHGFSDKDMERIVTACKILNGKVVAIKDKTDRKFDW